MKQLLSKIAFCAMLGLSAVAISGHNLSAFAAGDGDDSSTSNTVKKCKKGKIWDKKKKKCVKKSASLDQESIYEAGRDLARAGRYDEAISVLMYAPQLDDKRVLNFLGYANRKLGRLDLGIEYYERSMRKDPDYALVREYYGEALLQKNNLAGAQEQLTEIERICGNKSCEAFEDLAEEIKKYEKKQG